MKKNTLSSSNLITEFLGILGLTGTAIFFFSQVIDGAKSIKYNIYMATIALAIVAFLCLLIANISRQKFKLFEKWENTFLLSAGCLGLAMMLALPPLAGDDEWSHFLGAYHCSNMMLGIEDIPHESMYMRTEDATYVEYYVDFNDFYEKITDRPWLKPIMEDKPFYIGLTYMISWYRYVAPAMGITLGRILNLGVLGVMFLGRLFNFLQFLLLGYFAVRLTPAGKMQLTAVALLPQVLSLCTSFSYDCISISVTMLYGAMILRCSSGEHKIRPSDILILLACILAFIPNKGVYLIFCLMLFAIPRSNIKEFLIPKKNRILGILILVVLILSLLVMYPLFVRHVLDGLENGLLGDEPAYTEQFAGIEGFSIKKLLEDPVHGLSLVGNTLVLYGVSDFLAMIGHRVGYASLRVEISYVWIIPMVAVMVLSAFLKSDNFGKDVGKTSRVKESIIDKKRCWIVFSVTAFITALGIYFGCLLRFTPLFSLRVQTQPRYFLPVFIMGIMMSGVGHFEKKPTEKETFLLTIIYILAAASICNIIKYL